MPTTCGFPNCKFRSRYRGQEDNRHFYRIPKRPPILRQAWLCAIGRSEETVVSQLRICSAHFYGGEKREGDIPVADPQIDPPEFIELPPKEARSSERRARLKGHFAPSSVVAAASSSSGGSALAFPARGERPPQLPSLIRSATASAARRALAARGCSPAPPPLLLFPSPNNRLLPLGGSRTFNNTVAGGKGATPATATTTTPPAPPHCAGSENTSSSSNDTKPPDSSTATTTTTSSSSSSSSFIFPQHPSHFAFASSAFLSSFFGMNKNLAANPLQQNHACMARMTPPVVVGGPFSGTKPLVALLDGRDCSIEMPLLKDIATVAFCDAQTTGEIHEKVLNEATAALLYHSISLGRDDLHKFKALKMVVRIGSGVHNVDVQAASELGIAICHTPAECLEETADTIMSLILSMFRRTFWAARTVQIGKQPSGIEQLRDLMTGSVRVRGSTLGLIGLGRVGMAVALRAKAFGFKVLFYDPYLTSGIEKALNVERCTTLAEMLGHSDCVSLQCPLQSDTRNIINVETIKALKFGAFLVNTGEPELIQSSALLSALKTGHVRAAALDYSGTAQQPQQQRSGERELLDVLSTLPNVICTPHCAWYSDESSRDLREAAAREVRRALTGSIPEDLKNCVNRTELMAMKRLIASSALPMGLPPSSSVQTPALFGNSQQTAMLAQRQRNQILAQHPVSKEFGVTQLPINPGLVGLCPPASLAADVSSSSAAGVVPSFFSSASDSTTALSAYQQQLLMLQPQLLQQLVAQQQHNQNVVGQPPEMVTTPFSGATTAAHLGGGSGRETATGTPSLQDSVINHFGGGTPQAQLYHHLNQHQCSSSGGVEEIMDREEKGEQGTGGRMEQDQQENNQQVQEKLEQHQKQNGDGDQEGETEGQQRSRHSEENATSSFMAQQQSFPNSPLSHPNNGKGDRSSSICNGSSEAVEDEMMKADQQFHQ